MLKICELRGWKVRSYGEGLGVYGVVGEFDGDGEFGEGDQADGRGSVQVDQED